MWRTISGELRFADRRLRVTIGPASATGRWSGCAQCRGGDQTRSGRRTGDAERSAPAGVRAGETPARARYRLRYFRSLSSPVAPAPAASSRGWTLDPDIQGDSRTRHALQG